MRTPRIKLISPTNYGPVGTAVLRALFAISAIVATFATYLSVADVGNTSTAGSPMMTWLLVANLFIILILAAALMARIYRLFRENRSTQGGARLRLRIIALFGLAAMVPTIIAALLGTLINRSVENWFSERVYAVIENASDAANASFTAVISDVRSNVTEAAKDLNDASVVAAFTEAPLQFKEFLTAESQLRNLPVLAIYNSQKEIVFSTQNDTPLTIGPMSELNWIAAKNGKDAVSVSEDFVVSTLTRLTAYPNAYLYSASQGPISVGKQLKATQAGLEEYRAAGLRKDSLRTVFVLSYIESALLVLLGTAWLGMYAAGQIATPIGDLAAAARSVRDGDLSVRLDRPKGRDEIDDLSQAFNQMTMRLSRQRRDLDSARLEAEGRSEFIETVLSGVEAGVIRVDPLFKITLANASAGRLLELSSEMLQGALLHEVAPEFLSALRKAVESSEAIGSNIQITSGRGTRDIHVRISPEAEMSGFVVTFHDTTRLVAGQRQAAWKDVARRIAHEIRNPLTPIQLSAERIQRRFGKQITIDKDTFDSCTDTILRQVGDIGRMVEEFSSFARMPKPTLAPFDLNELVQNIAFAQRLASPTVAIVATVPEQKSMMTGDERLLGQALTNIIKNARESVERHILTGEIKVGSVSINLEVMSEKAILTVRDTGVGFPVEDRSRLLEPYVTTRETGVGLGLAIVSRIVEDHGGEITLGDNELAESGARVNISLPLTVLNEDEELTPSSEGVA
ncbi:sensor histidine kinase NtrY-like [Hirschia baltica]|uniref:histidine kinase n=1 Tax=Hirschia baltica (strain ATCC 49814 / DSM 5838 / IFAM 1418) TaxID=582402 RepID=C6XJQ4_HIRBI|nr:ATP-binding protein [Hirschia baltica]ACT59349.1 PAS/PAC sensor signal transduction histidine kinase [Hirschia baltica ATCC 49814]